MSEAVKQISVAVHQSAAEYQLHYIKTGEDRL